MGIIGLDIRGAQRLLEFVRPQRLVLAAALVLGIGGTVAALAQPLVVGRVLDAVTNGRPVFGSVMMLVGLFAINAALSTSQDYLVGRSGETIVLNVRRAMLGRLMRLPIATHNRNRIGDLLSRVGTDSTLLGTALTDNFTNLATSGLTFLGAVVLMAVIDPLLLLIALGCVLAATGSVLAISSRVRVADEEAQRSLGNLGATLERALRAIRTVKISRAEQREIEGLSQEAHSVYEAGLRATKLEAMVQPATIIAVQGSFVLVLGIGGARLASGALSLGDLVSFLLYLLYLVSPLLTAFTAVTNLQRGLAALGRIDEVLTLPIEKVLPDNVQEVPHKITANSLTAEKGTAKDHPVIQFDSVTFDYDYNVPVLKGISFSVPEFTRTALVGPSGAGKSTIFSLIEGFYSPKDGVISVDGTELDKMSLHALRDQVGYVEQDTPVMAGSIRSNLLYTNPTATEKELEEVVDSTNLRVFLESLPDGLDTEVGDGGILLSGGERQRVSIARALLAQPRLLLLDEVTSQLDAANEQCMRNAIAKASEKCTVIAIAHRLSTVIDADQLIVIEHGKVRAIGTHQELIESDTVYQRLASTQLAPSNTNANLGK